MSVRAQVPIRIRPLFSVKVSLDTAVEKEASFEILLPLKYESE
jgi:hypothetical protein